MGSEHLFLFLFMFLCLCVFVTFHINQHVYLVPCAMYSEKLSSLVVWPSRLAAFVGRELPQRRSIGQSNNAAHAGPSLEICLYIAGVFRPAAYSYRYEYHSRYIQPTR